MWTCADCGLEQIEDSLGACPACGAPKTSRCPPGPPPEPVPPVPVPLNRATWPQCVALYKDTDGHLRLWKGANTTLTKRAASALIQAIRNQQAKGRTTFSFSLERGNEALRRVNFQSPDFADWRDAGFPLR